MVTTSSRTIWARGLEKSFGDVKAVDGLDLDARPGSCLGLLGPNGAGKTTTIEILEGLQQPDRGQVDLLGMSWKKEAEHLRRRIGVQLQETHLPDKLRVCEVLRVFKSFYPHARSVAETMELIGLTEKSRAQVSQLSGGQRQRLSLGCALIHEPDVLFLDEPTTGLDPNGRRQVWDVVESFKAAGGTVLLTTHFMEEAERLADQLLIIDHGKVLTRGSPEQIVASLDAESVLDVSVAAGEQALSGAALAEALPAERLEALPDVLSVLREEGRLRLGTRNFEGALSALLGELRDRGLTLGDLNVHRPTLEDVFVSITGHGLQAADEDPPE